MTVSYHQMRGKIPSSFLLWHTAQILPFRTINEKDGTDIPRWEREMSTSPESTRHIKRVCKILCLKNWNLHSCRSHCTCQQHKTICNPEHLGGRDLRTNHAILNSNQKGMFSYKNRQSFLGKRLIKMPIAECVMLKYMHFKDRIVGHTNESNID